MRFVFCYRSLLISLVLEYRTIYNSIVSVVRRVYFERVSAFLASECIWQWWQAYYECIIASVFVGDTGCWCILSVFLASVVSDNGGWWVQMWDKRHSVGALFWSQARDLYHKFLLLKGVPNTKNSCKVRGVNRTESRNIEKVGLLCKFEQFCLFIFFSVHAKRQAPQRSWKMAWACSFLASYFDEDRRQKIPQCWHYCCCWSKFFTTNCPYDQKEEKQISTYFGGQK